MKIVNMHEAKTQLSRLVQAIRNGAESQVVIAVDGVPAARLIPYEGSPPRTLGIDHGLVTIADDFDEPDARIAAWFDGKP